MIENKSLAQSLYKSVEVDKMIPPEFYKAVAEIVFYLSWRVRLRQGRSARARRRMLRQGNSYTLEREKALADGLRDVAAELRLIDAADLVAFIRTEQFANIANLVNSSTELYYKPGTLSFGRSGDIDLKWGGTPTISLDMEFHHVQVSVYFRLLLEALQAGIEIDYINFERAAPTPTRTRSACRGHRRCAARADRMHLCGSLTVRSAGRRRVRGGGLLGCIDKLSNLFLILEIVGRDRG